MSSRVFRFARRLCLFASAAKRTCRRSGRTALLLSLNVLLLVPCDLFAGSASGKMSVSVTVIARAVLSVEGPTAVTVTGADVARGYVEIATPIRLTTRTNSRAGYLLTATPFSANFTVVDLSTPDASIALRGTDAWLQRPYIAGGETLAMHARLWLAPGTAAGTYEFPVTFSASPL